MRLSLNDIIGKHKGSPCVIAGHGPSMDSHKKDIEDLQRKKEVLRISTNNWFDYYGEPPDYWVLSNYDFTMEAGLTNNHFWQSRGYPPNAYNSFKVPIFFADVADFTPYDLIGDLAEFDYLPYDTRHFKGHTCGQILENFNQHYKSTGNRDFLFYGNNSHMWVPPDADAFDGSCASHYLTQPVCSFRPDQRCCFRVDGSRLTIQEQVQQHTGYHKHCDTLHCAPFFSICFAILMGCNPIYLSGLDLNYHLNYGRNTNNTAAHLQGYKGHLRLFGKHIQDGFSILRDSAALKGIKIKNLLKNAWYQTIEEGDLPSA